MGKQLRIVFFGTPEFAVNCLKTIHESKHEVIAVVSAPDRKSGRGQKIKSSAVATYAKENSIELLQPVNLKAQEFIEAIQQLNADLFVVVAFRMLPEKVWNMPPLGSINLHASLLPAFRGAAPINWAIINGETETGVSTFFLKHEIDTGDLILQEAIAITDRETAGSLHDKLMDLGASTLQKSLDKISEGEYAGIPQKKDESLLAKRAPKLDQDMAKIDWSRNMGSIDQLIRGLSPYPAAWTSLIHEISGKQYRLKIFECYLEDQTCPNLSLSIDDKLIKVSNSSGTLVLETIQLEGKKRMKSHELLNGFDLNQYQLSEE